MCDVYKKKKNKKMMKERLLITEKIGLVKNRAIVQVVRRQNNC